MGLPNRRHPYLQVKIYLLSPIWLKRLISMLFNNFFAWHIKKDKQAALRQARRSLALQGMRRTEYLAPLLNAEDLDLVRTNLVSFINAGRKSDIGFELSANRQKR